MFVFSITVLHVYYTVSAMYMYKCCILMGFIAYWNFQSTIYLSINPKPLLPNINLYTKIEDNQP